MACTSPQQAYIDGWLGERKTMFCRIKFRPAVGSVGVLYVVCAGYAAAGPESQQYRPPLEVRMCEIHASTDSAAVQAAFFVDRYTPAVTTTRNPQQVFFRAL